MDIIWKIVDTERNTTDGFVTTAHWTVTAIDGNYSADTYGCVGWGGELVIPYEQLTEETILNWVWQSVEKEVNEAALISQIERQKSPTKLTGVPW